MSWPCKLISVIGTRLVHFEAPPGGGRCGKVLLIESSGELLEYDDLPIGTMFYSPEKPVIEGEDPDYDGRGWPWWWAQDHYLSDFYKQNNSSRRPLFVILPSRILFVVDGKCWKDGVHYSGWSVSGVAPNITMAPSINIVGSYHGFLQNGVISDDCEGRKF